MGGKSGQLFNNCTRSIRGNYTYWLKAALGKVVEAGVGLVDNWTLLVGDGVVVVPLD